MEVQEKDILRILSPYKNLWNRLLSNEKAEILAELASLNTPGQLANLKKLAGDYS